MRLTALLAATVLAAIAWMACWQEVQLVRLKHQIRAVATVSEPAGVEPTRPEVAFHPARSTLRAPLPSIDRLRALLSEREQAVADARDAAAQFGIAAGPEMDQAVAFSTADLDQSIAKLIGPAAAAQLAALNEPSIPAAPMTPAPVAPAPIYVTVPPAQVYVTVAAPAPVMVAEAPALAEPDTEDETAAYPYQQTGGLGWGYVTSGRTERHKPTQLEELKSLTASAGIPLAASPLGGVGSTSPLLLMRQHMAAGR